MAKFGRGAVYTKDVYGRPLHKRTEAFMKEAKQYYDARHEKLIEACSSNKDILLLDIHSFNAQMASFLIDDRPLPDICFGFNNDDSSCPDLVEEIIKWGKVNRPLPMR